MSSASDSSAVRRRIFISYRRDQAAHAVGRLAEELRRRFGKDNVFHDLTSIEPGVDFSEALQKGLELCAAALIVIGPNWASGLDAKGRRRLDNSDDWVRHEVEKSLQNPDVRVFPVLIDDARMPESDDLPEPLRPLTRRQAFVLTTHHWGSDVAEVATYLARIPGLGASTPSPRDDNRLSDHAPEFLGDESRQNPVMQTAAVTGVADIHAGSLGYSVEASKDVDAAGAIPVGASGQVVGAGADRDGQPSKRLAFGSRRSRGIILAVSAAGATVLFLAFSGKLEFFADNRHAPATTTTEVSTRDAKEVLLGWLDSSDPAEASARRRAFQAALVDDGMPENTDASRLSEFQARRLAEKLGLRR
jgi:hypothetical protein